MEIRAIVLFFVALSVSWADEAQPESLPQPREVPQQEVLPVPRALPVPGMPFYAGMPYYAVDPPPQFGRRSVWQLMSPNYKAQMRPTVVISPNGGGYYLYNGEPYPWITNRPTLYRAYLLD